MCPSLERTGPLHMNVPSAWPAHLEPGPGSSQACAREWTLEGLAKNDLGKVLMTPYFIASNLHLKSAQPRVPSATASDYDWQSESPSSLSVATPVHQS